MQEFAGYLLIGAGVAIGMVLLNEEELLLWKRARERQGIDFFKLIMTRPSQRAYSLVAYTCGMAGYEVLMVVRGMRF